ncbi:MAG: hypothetical protein FH753_16390 [Firmicutes bacterium]|nr:hypothetical protein [Bacillota bacterium]
MNGLINKRIKTIISCTLIFVLIFMSLSSGAFATPPNNSLGLNMKKIDKNKRIKPKNVLPKVKDKPVELKKMKDKIF